MYGPVFSIFVKPLNDDLGWSISTITIAFTIGSLGGAITSAVIGSWLDRHGARLVMVVTGVIIAGSLFAIALMNEPWHFWIAYGVGRSVAVAGIGLGTSVAIANWFVRRRGRAIAIRAAGQRGGQSLVPLLILPVLLAAGWRESFVLMGVAALLLIAAPAWIFVRRSPEDYGLLPDGDIPGPSGLGEPQPENDEYSWTLVEARRTRSLWMVLIGLSAGIAAQIAVNVHVVAAVQEKGVSAPLAVTIATLFTGVAALSMVVWGLFVEKFHVRTMSIICMGLCVVAMGILGLAETYSGAAMFAIVFGLATGGWTVAQMLMIPNYFGRRHAGLIKGFVSPIEGAIGMTGPLAAAIIRDVTGSYDLAWMLAAGTFFVGLLAFVAAPPLRDPA